MPAEMKIWNIPENLTFTLQKIVLYIWLSHEVCCRHMKIHCRLSSNYSINNK